jgi:phytoene/squalene synthetase
VAADRLRPGRAQQQYDRLAARTAARVLATYSTSFGWGTRLLGPVGRRDIRAVYGLVRVADEIVDSYRGPTARIELDRLEEATERGLSSGYSANLVVHAFARTARHTGIGPAETRPFFASMRADLQVAGHD